MRNLYKDIMSIPLLKLFLRETVVDASKRFAKRRSDTMKGKLRAAAGALPDALQQQEEQEKDINSKLNNLRKTVDRFVLQKRGRLALPQIFQDEFSSDSSLFDVISYSTQQDEYWEDLKVFVTGQAPKFRAALDAVKAELRHIEDYADSLTWPAPWRRYTNWQSKLRDVSQFESNLNKLLQ